VNDPFTLIWHFNRVEAALWFVAALGLPFVVKSCSRKQRLSVFASALAALRSLVWLAGRHPLQHYFQCHGPE